MATDMNGRKAAADRLARKLEGFSFSLDQDELDELGGVLAASKATRLDVGSRPTDDVRAFHLDVASYAKMDACW